MGNISGVRKRGLTLRAVEDAMREVLEERFPGVFVVDGSSGGIALRVRDREGADGALVLVWWDEGDVYPGLVGGKHPRMGQFGYWLLSIIELGVAKKLGARVFDEGVGYYRPAKVARGAAPTFAEYVQRNDGGMSWYACVRHDERGLLPKALLPWFDAPLVRMSDDMNKGA